MAVLADVSVCEIKVDIEIKQDIIKKKWEEFIMKKALSTMLVLLLLLPFFVLNEAAATENAPFDKSVFESSSSYIYDKFAKEWKIIAAWEKKYSDANIGIGVLLFDQYITEGWGPELRVAYIALPSENYFDVTALRAMVDDKMYSFEKLVNYNATSSAYGGTVMRAFLNSLKSGKEVAFQIEYKNTQGAAFSLTIDPVDISSLSDLINIANLFEKANVWTAFSSYEQNDLTFSASME